MCAVLWLGCGAVRGVPVSVRGPPPQRYSRAKCAVPHCARTAPQSLDCVRGRSLPGPAHFASLRSAAGAVGRAVGTGARALPCGGHSARMLAHPSGSASPNLPSESFAFCGAFPLARAAMDARLIRPWATSGLVGIPPVAACRPWSAMRASRRPCALRPRSRRASAGALFAHVRFCGARSARLTLSKVSALTFDCVKNPLTASYLPRAKEVRSWLEGRRHSPRPDLQTHTTHANTHRHHMPTYQAHTRNSLVHSSVMDFVSPPATDLWYNTPPNERKKT